jgi:hypothetical protein
VSTSGPRAIAEPITDLDADLYASQIVMPEIGARGQARLLVATVLVVGDPTGSRVAARYLRGTGVDVADDRSDRGTFDCAVVADLDWLAAWQPERLRRLPSPIVWYRLEGATIHSGVTTRASAPTTTDHGPSRQTGISCPAAAVLHRLAGAEAAITAVAYLLGWCREGATFSIELD